MELEKLKAYADRMREPAIQKLLSKDDVYQTECEAERKAEQKYISLDLTDHERRICDSLLRILMPDGWSMQVIPILRDGVMHLQCFGIFDKGDLWVLFLFLGKRLFHTKKRSVY